MDRSRVSASASVEFAPSVDTLLDSATDGDVVIVDLSRVPDLSVLQRLPGRVIGFAPHGERAILDRARDAGCDVVLARSAFFSRLPELVASDR